MPPEPPPTRKESEDPPDLDSGGSISGFSTIRTREDVLHKDRIRRNLVYGILVIFAVEVVASIAIAIFNFDRIDKVVQLMAFLMTPTLTILGTISAFYFGMRNNKDALFDK